MKEDGVRVKEDQLARTTAVGAGLKALRAFEEAGNGPARSAALGHVVAEYEARHSELVAEGESGAHARQRRASEKFFRMVALEAERRTVDDLWRRNVIADEVHRPLQQLLDHEEAMLRALPAVIDE
jgi:CPA1 family monovalent cation:H+ antiporter